MKVLQNEPTGSYLVRLSAKLWGYTVSVKSEHILYLYTVIMTQHFPHADIYI